MVIKLYLQKIGDQTLVKILKILFLIYTILFLTGCSFVASRIIPVNKMEPPSGKFNVGTQIFHWTDESRDEWFSDDPIDKRELMVQVWYPSKLTSSQIDPWIDNARNRTSELVEFYKVPKFVAKAVDRVDSHSYYGAKPIDEQIFPIIIYSHGFQGFRSLNTIQIQELASNGYIVFAVDHTYDALSTFFPDGRKVLTAEKYCYGCEEDDFYKVFRPQIETRVDDIIFILNQIDSIKNKKINSNFHSTLDTDNIGIFGHSFGGGTSLAATIIDPRIKSCISLDGWYVPIHPDIYNQGLSKPFLHIGRPKWDYNDNINYKILDQILELRKDEAYKLSIEGSHHYDYTDVPHLSSLTSIFRLSSDLNSTNVLDITNTTVLGFFDEHLKSNNSNWKNDLSKKLNTTIKEFQNDK